MKKMIAASRGRWNGEAWIQRLEIQEEVSNTLTCVWKDNMVLELYEESGIWGEQIEG